MADSDAQLLDAARAGDRKALEKLLERHQAQIYRFGMKLCRDPEDAKDVLQDTLIAMARGVRDFQGASSISTWLFTIARSFCIKKRRKSRFAPQEECSLDADTSTGAEAAQVSDPRTQPEEAAASQQISQAIDRAIRALEPGYREVFVLRDLEGLSAAEVAEVLKISVQAVKSRLHRARLAVRASLLPTLGIPADTVTPASASSCPDVLTMFSQKLEGEISANVCADMEKHLESCARCSSACDSLKRTLAMCSTTPSTQVPSEVQKSVRIALRTFLADSA